MFTGKLTLIIGCNNVPQTYKEAVRSVTADEGVKATSEEMKSLKESATFTLTSRFSGG